MAAPPAVTRAANVRNALWFIGFLAFPADRTVASEVAVRLGEVAGELRGP